LKTTASMPCTSCPFEPYSPGYGGTIFAAGLDYLLWSQRPVQFEELQVLKPEERYCDERFGSYPGEPCDARRRSFHGLLDRIERQSVGALRGDRSGALLYAADGEGEA
jgi:hypothetical protein